MNQTVTRQNLYDYFEDCVSTVREEQGVGLSGNVVRYLASLLCDLGKTEHLFRAQQPPTLAEMHFRGLSLQSEHEALGHYKHLGDFALYIGGYFSESLQRKTVGIAYYADMGGAAYYRAANLSAGPAEIHTTLHSLFTEMATHFRECLGVLSEVADRNRGDSMDNLANLFERWLTTRDPYTGERLAKLGALPIGPIDD